MDKLTFTFEDSPPHDTLLLRLGEAGSDLTDDIQREIGARILSATKRFLFAVFLESDYGLYLLYVPEKKDANLSNARCAMKTLLTQTGHNQALSRDLKFMDFDALIEFGLFRSKPNVPYTKKKNPALPLTVENADFEAEEPYDRYDEYLHQVEIGLVPILDDQYLKMIKYVPVSIPMPIGWIKAGTDWEHACPDATPLGWEPLYEHGTESVLEPKMKELALEDAPAESGRKTSVPASKGRIQEDLERQMAEGPKVRVRLGPLSAPTFDGNLYILKAKSSKERGEAEWIETLGNAMEEKYGGVTFLEETYDEAIELMDKGALPEVERDPNPDNKKSLAVHRCRKLIDKTQTIHDAYVGKMTDQEFKRACKRLAGKHGTKDTDKCTQCDKPAPAATHYLVISEEIWKPIAELANEKAKDTALFCSHKCENKWQEVLICPDCNTFEYTKTSLSSYPSSKAMLDMTAQYHRRLLQTELEKKDQTGKEVEKPIKMWLREVPRISVPICVTCSATMLPRNPLAPHLCMHRCQFDC